VARHMAGLLEVIVQIAIRNLGILTVAFPQIRHRQIQAMKFLIQYQRHHRYLRLRQGNHRHQHRIATRIHRAIPVQTTTVKIRLLVQLHFAKRFIWSC
jgi:hypothetical protein